MSVRVNPRLIKELEDFGAEDVSKCYHCGNCSAACPFSDDPVIFPRRAMRYLQMGASSRLLFDPATGPFASRSTSTSSAAVSAANSVRAAPNLAKP